MQVQTIKLKNGEEFIAEVLKSDEANMESVHVRHPVVLVQTPNGEYDFSPWIATSQEKDFYIAASDVRFAVDPMPELVEAFVNNFKAASPILVPKSKLILG